MRMLTLGGAMVGEASNFEFGTCVYFGRIESKMMARHVKGATDVCTAEQMRKVDV